MAVSPDGATLAYVASDSSSTDFYIWVRPISALTALKLPGTKGAWYPFWSPDSKHIGFFQGGKMMKIAAAGGPALTVCDAPSGRLGTWNEDNTIVFSPHFRRVLMRVSAAGGMPDTLTALDTTASDQTHRWPWFLPDGQHYLYFARTGSGSGSEKDAICLRSLDGTVYKRLIMTSSNVAYAAGHVLYMRNSTLMAHPFDDGALEFTGDAFPIAENVSFNNQFSRGSFSVSETGILVYQSGAFVEGSLLMTYSREGIVLDTIGEPTSMFDFSLSNDETRLLMDIQDVNANNWDIWSYDLNRGIRTRLTFAAADDGSGIWHPNNKQFVFGSERANDKWSMFTKATNGVGEASALLDTSSSIERWPTDWSSDGNYIVFQQNGGEKTDEDLWALPLVGDQLPIQLTDSEFDEYEGALSPDGRWLAYVSEESGKQEVYVAPFPGMGSKWQVSASEGDRPRWRRDGKELFYLNNSDEIMAASVDGSGSSFEIGKVVKLFKITPQRPGNLYQVYGDGQKFIVNTNIAPTDISTITLVTNWDMELPEE
jgi:Tol biopolymer transport system component